MDSQNCGHYEWASFQAQQSAEKALKALLLFFNIDAWGHGLVHLFKKLRNIKQDQIIIDDDIFNLLLKKCQELDRHYIQPRYPNGFISGYPSEYYNKDTSEECIEYAKDIISFVEKQIEKLSSSS
ncbi:MAG: HEPN domain-containing protein [Promethearchaeia archaeon]